MERVYSREPDGGSDPAPPPPSARPKNWVDELIAMTRPGIEIAVPARLPHERSIPFDYDDFN